MAKSVKSAAAQSPAVRSLQREQAAQKRPSKEKQLDRGLEDSFPASDPVSVISTSTAGKPQKKRKR